MTGWINPARAREMQIVYPRSVRCTATSPPRLPSAAAAATRPSQSAGVVLRLRTRACPTLIDVLDLYADDLRELGSAGRSGG